MKINLKIKELRLERKLTQAELAIALSVDRTTLVKWERGTHSPDLVKLVEIADFFDVSADVLLGRKEY